MKYVATIIVILCVGILGGVVVHEVEKETHYWCDRFAIRAEVEMRKTFMSCSFKAQDGAWIEGRDEFVDYETKLLDKEIKRLEALIKQETENVIRDIDARSKMVAI